MYSLGGKDCKYSQGSKVRLGDINSNRFFVPHLLQVCSRFRGRLILRQLCEQPRRGGLIRPRLLQERLTHPQ